MSRDYRIIYPDMLNNFYIKRRTFDAVLYFNEPSVDLLKKIKFKSAEKIELSDMLISLNDFINNDINVNEEELLKNKPYWAIDKEDVISFAKEINTNLRIYNDDEFSYHYLPADFIVTYLKLYNMNDKFHNLINFKKVLLIDNLNDCSDISEYAEIFLKVFIPRDLLILE